MPAETDMVVNTFTDVVTSSLQSVWALNILIRTEQKEVKDKVVVYARNK